MKFSINQMIQKIEKQSELNKELPMVIKLAAYKRDLMLTGLGNEQSLSKDMGQQIIQTLKNEELK